LRLDEPMRIFFPKEKVKQGEGLDLCMAVATYYCICVLLLRYETRRTVLETCRATQQVVISLSSSAALQHPRVCGRCNLGAGLREPSVLGYVAADPDGPRGPSTMSVLGRTGDGSSSVWFSLLKSKKNISRWFPKETKHCSDSAGFESISRSRHPAPN
jgi:hypothetical protein